MIMPTVLKFGGTSVGDTAAFENVASIVRARVNSVPVVVVSAMSRVTDALLASTNIAHDGQPDNAITSLTSTFQRHKQTAAELLTREGVANYSNIVDQAEHNLSTLLQRIADEASLTWHSRIQCWHLAKLSRAF
jgi:aspartate kinase